MFTLTDNIKKAVELINGISTSKYPRLLTRVVNKLHLPNERSFTTEEEEKLQSVFDMDQLSLNLVLEATELFLHQAAYHGCEAAAFSKELEKIGLHEDKVAAFTDSWSSNSKLVTERLRKNTVAPKQLEDINWRVNIRMADSKNDKLHEPNAVFELGVKDNVTKTKSKTLLEFSRDDLLSFYNQLEDIQTQIDALT